MLRSRYVDSSARLTASGSLRITWSKAAAGPLTRPSRLRVREGFAK